MKKKSKLVFKIGINDLTELVTLNGKNLPFYLCWKDMLRRCYDNKCHIRSPTYIGCSVCKEWLLLSNFKIWYDLNYIEGFALDKDILYPGNKVYSPETARFVPSYLNSLLTDHRNDRGKLPLGIHAAKPNKNGRINTTYPARCMNGSGHRISKTFKTISEAKAWYSITKRIIVKKQATKAFLDNAIKTDVYLALVRREW
ncbi:MAG: hypothetical protein M0R17_03545 [Candidatus Omnitrophica bacterium]|jgi:hypothetical protein|nr:hypothetical protein [Candidatus Omnitrophota bacterium]